MTPFPFYEADGGFLARGAFVFIEPAEVKFHLADVGGLEGFQLQFHSDKAAQVAVKKEQVEVEVIPADTHAFLAGYECKACAQLQQHAFDFTQDGGFKVPFAEDTLEAEQIKKVRIAKHDVRREFAIAHLAYLCSDEALWPLRQSGALVKHGANLLPQGADIPVLDATHFGIEIAGEWFLDREQFHKMAPTQLCRQRRHNFRVGEKLRELDGAIDCGIAESPSELCRQFSRHCRENLFPVCGAVVLEVFLQQPLPEMPEEKRSGGVRHHRNALAGGKDQAAQVFEQGGFVHLRGRASRIGLAGRDSLPRLGKSARFRAAGFLAHNAAPIFLR